MSFTSEVKKQICTEDIDIRSGKAQLCALFLMRATMHMNWQGMYLSFQTENASIAKHVFRLLKMIYEVTPRMSVIKKMQLKKNNIYRIQVYEKAEEILEDLMILNETGLHYAPNAKMIRSEKMARAFLQGAFLGSGSISDPIKSSYHLEMSCQEEELAQCIMKQMNRFFIPAKMIQRKNLYVVYVKQGDKIADFLRLCNASQALFNFEELRIQRDFYNQMTRLDNCELANEFKTINAGKKQIEYIELIEANKNKYGKISEKILRAMEVRKKNPEASIVELCDVMEEEFGETISKSGMKHRLAKIKEIALSIEEENK